MNEYLIFAGRHWEMVAALGIVIALIIADELQRHLRGARELEPTAAVMLLNRGAFVVDCRNRQEYEQGHIVGARHIPLNELDGRSKDLKRKRQKPILAVGANPRETARAVATLRKAGFETVFALKGGLAAWRKEHLPLEEND